MYAKLIAALDDLLSDDGGEPSTGAAPYPRTFAEVFDAIFKTTTDGVRDADADERPQE